MYLYAIDRFYGTYGACFSGIYASVGCLEMAQVVPLG